MNALCVHFIAAAIKFLANQTALSIFLIHSVTSFLNRGATLSAVSCTSLCVKGLAVIPQPILDIHDI